MLMSYPAGTTRTFSPIDNEGCDTDLNTKQSTSENQVIWDCCINSEVLTGSMAKPSP